MLYFYSEIVEHMQLVILIPSLDLAFYDTASFSVNKINIRLVKISCESFFLCNLFRAYLNVAA